MDKKSERSCQEMQLVVVIDDLWFRLLPDLFE